MNKATCTHYIPVFEVVVVGDCAGLEGNRVACWFLAHNLTYKKTHIIMVYQLCSNLLGRRLKTI